MKDHRDGRWIPLDKPRWPWPRRAIIDPHSRPYRIETEDWERMPL